MKKIIIILILPLLLLSCFPKDKDYSFDYEIIVTDSATNLESLNSEHDDYNSALPYPGERSEVYFSSNRNSNGNNYDIVFNVIDISFHKRDNILNFSIPTNAGTSSFQTRLLSLINTGHDELGPSFYPCTNGWDYFFYANNESGNFDIKFVHTPTLDWGTYNGQQRLYGPGNVTIANSGFDDLYPTLNQDKTKMLFCSNRENGSFDIYSIGISSDLPLHDYMTTSNKSTVIKETTLSGSANDKCPSINDNIIVFASDREGGYGGYDLYYSKFINNQWSPPENFGDKVNSSSDEYRPIKFSVFNSFDLIIFSSNRPGGKGGFDLYCANIGELLK